MRICYFGIYDPIHPRNVSFIGCLKRAGFDVKEVNCRERGLKKYFILGKQLIKERKKIDIVLIGFPGQQAVILAKILYRGPIIFNPLLSLFDAVILDQERYSKVSLRAVYFWILDYISFNAADHVILDCYAHVLYLEETFGVSRRKMSVIYMGADENELKPINGYEKKYEIHYYSSFLPVHGVDVIIKAANLLKGENINFILSGSGSFYQRHIDLAKQLKLRNVCFIGRIDDTKKLKIYLNTSWICLGLFGLRPRTKRGISSKVFEAICCARPVITEYTDAGAEILKDKESVLFVKPNDSEDLADKIMLLKKDETLRLKIAQNGRMTYDTHASYNIITKQLQELIFNM